MKVFRLYGQLVAGQALAALSPGLRVYPDPRTRRFTVKVGEFVLGTNDRVPPKIDQYGGQGGKVAHLVHRCDLLPMTLETKKRGSVSFYTLAAEANEEDTRVILFIQTGLRGAKGIGSFTVSESHEDHLPYAVLGDEVNYYAEGITMMSPGEVISITPQGASQPTLVRYDAKRGLVLETPGTMGSALSHVKRTPRPKRSDVKS